MRLLTTQKQYDYKSIEEFEKHRNKMMEKRWFVVGELERFTNEPDAHGNMYTATFSTDIA